MPILIERRLQKVRDLVLEHLKHQDGTHMSIAEATGQCDSSISQVLFDLHTERLIHIGSYTKKSSRHRYVRTWRIGPGTDATMEGLDTAMQQNAAAVLALLKTGDRTRSAISAALGWRVSNTWNVMRYLRDNDMIHVCDKIREPSGQRGVHVYRAGAGVDFRADPERPSRAKAKPKPVRPPPPVDPLMAALFGR